MQHALLASPQSLSGLEPTHGQKANSISAGAAGTLAAVLGGTEVQAGRRSPPYFWTRHTAATGALASSAATLMRVFLQSIYCPHPKPAKL